MLPAIKSILAGLNPARPPEPEISPAGSPSPSTDVTDVVTAQVAKKQKEMRRGTTKAKVASLTADLDTARADVARAAQTEGVAIYEGQNSTEQAQVTQQAGHRVAALEAALAIAIQKDDEAEVALHEAEQQLLRADRDVAIEAMMQVAMESEKLFKSVKRQRLEVNRGLTVLVKVGALTQRSVNEIMDQYAFYARIAFRHPADDESDSGSFRKYRGWYHCVAYLCGRAEP